MKIIVYYRELDSYEREEYSKERKVWRVDLYSRWIDKGKTDEEINESVEKYNASGGCSCQIIELPDEMEEVITFLLGEKQYKRYADMEDLDSSMQELSADIDNMHDDVWNMRENMEHIEEMFKKFKEKYIDELDNDND